jgi:hypothetical protein
VPQARKEYVRIAEEVFSIKSSWSKNAFEGQKLEDAVKLLLGSDHSEERILYQGSPCKVCSMNLMSDNPANLTILRFVCAVPQQDVGARGGPRLFRTYKVRENRSYDCTIWEACRATSAAPTYFESIGIGDEGEK